VLRPGGRLVILEFVEPRNPLMRWGSRLYTDHIMPRTASWIARDTTGAYRYLPRSIATFLDRPGFVRLLEAADFRDPKVRDLTFGICGLATGRVAS
jgi:demethylmenaquinone methyltransferase/2-methoxy-6-polyprenyl-1,4-benzoquinol methylase